MIKSNIKVSNGRIIPILQGNHDDTFDFSILKELLAKNDMSRIKLAGTKPLYKDSMHFTLPEGAVAIHGNTIKWNTQIQKINSLPATTYHRIDILVINDDGTFDIVEGDPDTVIANLTMPDLEVAIYPDRMGIAAIYVNEYGLLGEGFWTLSDARTVSADLGYDESVNLDIIRDDLANLRERITGALTSFVSSTEVAISSGQVKVLGTIYTIPGSNVTGITATAAIQQKIGVIVFTAGIGLEIVYGSTVSYGTQPLFPSIANNQISLSALLITDSGINTSYIWELEPDNPYRNIFLGGVATIPRIQKNSKYKINNLIIAAGTLEYTDTGLTENNSDFIASKISHTLCSIEGTGNCYINSNLILNSNNMKAESGYLASKDGFIEGTEDIGGTGGSNSLINGGYSQPSNKIQKITYATYSAQGITRALGGRGEIYNKIEFMFKNIKFNSNIKIFYTGGTFISPSGKSITDGSIGIQGTGFDTEYAGGGGAGGNSPSIGLFAKNSLDLNNAKFYLKGGNGGNGGPVTPDVGRTYAGGGGAGGIGGNLFIVSKGPINSTGFEYNVAGGNGGTPSTGMTNLPSQVATSGSSGTSGIDIIDYYTQLDTTEKNTLNTFHEGNLSDFFN
jgi:hypothetical protein